jgi:hypothetical protein
VATTAQRLSRLRRDAAVGGDQPRSPSVRCQQRGAETLEAPTISREGDNPTMMAADPQQQRLLKQLRDAGHQPVAFAELHAGGIAFPAAVVSELELNGYAIERVYDHGRLVGVRLLQPEPPDTPAAPRWRRPHR